VRPGDEVRNWPSLCESSTRYKRTLNFEACGRAQRKQTQKFVLRSALRPNQISFSHSLGPLLPQAQERAGPQLVKADAAARRARPSEQGWRDRSSRPARRPVVSPRWRGAVAQGPNRRTHSVAFLRPGRGSASLLPHWISSSAMANSVSGTVRPSALAVLRLMTNSNLVGRATGRSAGFSPLRMRPV
jgi:hypothetical protein